MSIYSDELNQRLLSGEPIQVTRRWFMECMAKEPELYFNDLSPQEQKFLQEIYEACVAWVTSQPEIKQTIQ